MTERERLKNYRLRKRLSQENIADSINKIKATISRYENGALIPSSKEISRNCTK